MIIEKETFYRRALLTAFWIRGCWGFFAWELVPFMLQLLPAVFLLIDLIVVTLGVMLMKRTRDRVFAIVFIAVTGYITCYYNGLSALFFLNGLRDFLGYIFMIPIFAYFLGDKERKARFMPVFDRHLFIFLIVQCPCMLFTFLMHGACDWGGGSLGNWNSGIITTLIFAVSFYLMQKRIDQENFWHSIWENKIYIILLFPTQLNETKVSFVYLLMYLVLLLPFNKRLFVRLLLAVPIVAFSLICALGAYVVSTGGSMKDILSIEYYTEMYLYDPSMDTVGYAEWLFDNDTGESDDIPRFTKFMLLSDLNEENPGHIMTGFGLGQFKGGTTIRNTDFYNKYEWMLIGTIPYAYHVYIQIGVIGLMLMFWFFFNLLSAPGEGFKRNYNVHAYIFLVYILLLMYNESIRDCFQCLVFTYLALASWKCADESEPVADDAMPQAGEHHAIASC